jgi:hypothetical protein
MPFSGGHAGSAMAIPVARLAEATRKAKSLARVIFVQDSFMSCLVRS